MTDVYVIGSSLPALAAAIEFSEVGLRVRVALDTSNGDAAHVDDRGVLDHEGALGDFLGHISSPIATGDEPIAGVAPVKTAPQPVQLRDAQGRWAVQAMPAVLGIPAVPMDARSLAILGVAGAARASLDRVKPVLTIGKAHDLGALVQNRLGRAALDRLVDPIVRERYGISSAEVEVAVAAPGLNEALTRAGSLSGAVLAVAERDVARETRIAPSSGWAFLTESLLERLRLFGAEIVTQLPGDARPTDRGWQVTEPDGTRVQTRVIVADPEVTLPKTVAAACELVAPAAWRGWASVEIDDPDLPEPGLDALQSVTLPNGELWSIRLVCDDHQVWWARCAGPRISLPGQRGDERGAPIEGLEQALLALGVRPRSKAAVVLRPAPYIAIERRDAEISALEALRAAEPSLVLVGAALVGGDLAHAVADARRVSVTVRRRLTGITE